MGARPGRSTLTALNLLTICVKTVWKASLGCVVSMLSLDIKGAFDNVVYERLLTILRCKGFLKWIMKLTYTFL